MSADSPEAIAAELERTADSAIQRIRSFAALEGESFFGSKWLQEFETIKGMAARLRAWVGGSIDWRKEFDRYIAELSAREQQAFRRGAKAAGWTAEKQALWAQKVRLHLAAIQAIRDRMASDQKRDHKLMVALSPPGTEVITTPERQGYIAALDELLEGREK